MKKIIIIIATFMLASCGDDTTTNGILDSQVSAPDAIVQQKCDIGTADYGFCPRDFQPQGAFKVTGLSGWSCKCTEEQMEQFEDTGQPPDCCTWTSSELYGYAYMTPVSEFDGTIVMHVESSHAPFYGSIISAKYYATYGGKIFIDRALVMLRSYADGQEALTPPYKVRHYIITPGIQGDTLTLSFSIAYPQPYFDEGSDDYRLDFIVTMKRMGDVTDCFDDIPERGLRFGHCHSGPVCHRLIAGCIPEQVCSVLTKDMTFFYSSWNPPSTDTCNVRYYDQFYSYVLNNGM